MGRLPSEAFDFYVGLGDERSYQKVAAHYGVGKRAVTKRARKERWTEQLAEMEAAAKRKAREQLQEGLDDLHLRHGRILRAMASRAVKAIQEYPLTSGMDGIRAAEAVIKLERLMAGEPGDHTQQTIAETTREEMRRFLAPTPKEGEDPGENDW